MELSDLVGQRLAIGITGTKVTPEIVSHFKELRAGGLILYRINFESPAQLKKLISDLEEALERKLLVLADHEGGRVIMFREGITVFPDNLAVGRTEKKEYVSNQGEIEARELRRMGIDVNLGPVLDVLTDAYSPNIGIRSYGKNWRTVEELGSARIKAMQNGSLSACAKHFPGKGHAPVDAHLGLPVIKSSWKEMEEIHLKPFLKAIETGVDCVMSSHPYYPNLDPEPNMIATFSRKIIFDYLRKDIGFKGVLFSDDLEMGAIKAICPIEEAGVRASQAGHDILLVCHDQTAQKKVQQSFLDAAKEKRISLKETEESVERIQKLIAKRKNRFEGGNPRPEESGEAMVEKICLESVSILKTQPSPSPFIFEERSQKSVWPVKKDKILIVFPRFSYFDEKIMVEKEVLNEESFLKSELNRYGISPSIKIVSIEPSEAEIHEVVESLKESDSAILFCFDAHLYPSNKILLEKVQENCKKPAIVLLRDPYDCEFVGKDVPCITDFGWRSCQIKAAIHKIFSE